MNFDMGWISKIGSSMAQGIENVVAFATSKRVLSMVASAVAAQHGFVSPQDAVIAGSVLAAGFTATDAMGKGKGAKGNT